MLTDLVDRGNGLVDSVLHLGNRDGGNSRGSIGGNSGSSGNSRGSSISGNSRSSSSNNSCGSNSSEARVSSSEARVSKTSQVLSISFSCGGSEGGSHEGRQGNKGLHYCL